MVPGERAGTLPQCARYPGHGRPRAHHGRSLTAEQLAELVGQLIGGERFRRRVGALRLSRDLLGALGRISAATLLRLGRRLDLPLPFLEPAPIPGILGIPGMPPPPRIWLHHLLRLAEALDQRVHRRPAPRRPWRYEARREPLRILVSRRSAGVIEWMMAATRSMSRSSICSSCLRASAMPGSIPRVCRWIPSS